jgi:hypothetical protein
MDADDYQQTRHLDSTRLNLQLNDGAGRKQSKSGEFRSD